MTKEQNVKIGLAVQKIASTVDPATLKKIGAYLKEIESVITDDQERKKEIREITDAVEYLRHKEG